MDREGSGASGGRRSRVGQLGAGLATSLAFRTALGLTSTVGIAAVTTAGCLERPIDAVEPITTSTVVDIVGRSAVNKIDLVLVIDNSGSMADKQEILATAVPQLVSRLVTPLCVDPQTGQPGPTPESSSNLGKCPDGLVPEFNPIQDINIGVISSSLGSVGTPTCEIKETTITPFDNGHLLSRTDPRDPNSAGPTYQGMGFLAWDPEGKRLCPGEKPGGEKCPGLKDRDELIANLTNMVVGVGEFGCGYEAPLEAAYRFLVDPAPWGTLTNVEGQVTLSGTDEALLEQRKAFLRPDSLLAVVVLTDENDCSFRADNLGGFAANGAQKMPRARSECATDPASPCCASCYDPAPEGCPGNGGCADPGNQQNVDNYYPEPDASHSDSHNNIRCWDQKRRFGTDYLYPTQRYVNAFSALKLDPGKLDLGIPEEGGGEDNPLFTTKKIQTRPLERVFVAGIVGVPWQLIARQGADGEPALKDGLDADGAPVGGFRTFDELVDKKVWEQLIPSDAADQPDSMLMVESPIERETSAKEKEINGGEWDTKYGDLQYACTFDLLTECDADCADCGTSSVEGNGNPLCDPENLAHQVRAKAYPGTRVLEVLHGMGDQGISASICPDQLDDVTAKNYGYTPAVYAIIDRLKDSLKASCQSRELEPDKNGDTPCVVIEVSDSEGACAARCAEDGRAPISDRTKVAGSVVQATIDGEDTDEADSYDCLCEIVQLRGKPTDDDWETSDRYLCQNEQFPPEQVNGWCYVDASATPPIGNSELKELEKCADTERRLVRPVNNGVVSPGGRLYITCTGEATGGQ